MNPTILHRFEEATKYEWLETNGLGGYASSSVLGANTRRYHGLLVAATKPPVGRTVLISKLEETLILDGQRHELSTNKYQGAISPNGYIFLEDFKRGLFPVFYYKVNGVSFSKTIAAVQGENTVIIRYEILDSDRELRLELKPMTAPRDYHDLSHANHVINQEAKFHDDVLQMQPYADHPEWFIQARGASFQYEPDWYFRFEYPVELERGMEAHEDLFTPGSLSVSLKPGETWSVVLSDTHPSGKDANELFEKERTRRLGLLAKAPASTPLVEKLTLAADQFIVDRGEDLKTIIAGYHWFTDWGRDTMIALPGLCLSTGRFEDAQKILKAFAQSTSNGMLPNRFPDNGEEPEYNNIDATLWFFVAVYKYFLATQDLTFIEKEILPVMDSILEWHQRGTRYNIRMDADGLLMGGEDGQQLTWMDAKVDNWVVTPRRGKAVEVNALWYNAWKIYAALLYATGKEGKATQVNSQADEILNVFQQKFWNEEKQYLFDVVNDDFKDDALRPNQLFAISLPFSMLSHHQAQSVVHHVEKKLLTPVGLRSLEPHHDGYIPTYIGDRYQRDGAYHQGTVWSWLLGPYMDALINVKNGWGKEEVRQMLSRFEQHLEEACVGNVSEVFDGGGKNIPRGCVAQAWGVSEILRVVNEYSLYSEPLPIRRHTRKAKSKQEEKELVKVR